MAEDGVTIAKANGFAYNSADGFHDPAQFLNPAKKRHAQPGGKPDDLPSAVNETPKSPAAVAVLTEKAKFKKASKSPAASRVRPQSPAPGGVKGRGAKGGGKRGKSGVKGGKSAGAMVAAAAKAPS